MTNESKSESDLLKEAESLLLKEKGGLEGKELKSLNVEDLRDNVRRLEAMMIAIGNRLDGNLASSIETSIEERTKQAPRVLGIARSLRMLVATFATGAITFMNELGLDISPDNQKYVYVSIAAIAVAVIISDTMRKIGRE